MRHKEETDEISKPGSYSMSLNCMGLIVHGQVQNNKFSDMQTYRYTNN